MKSLASKTTNWKSRQKSNNFGKVDPSLTLSMAQVPAPNVDAAEVWQDVIQRQDPLPQNAVPADLAAAGQDPASRMCFVFVGCRLWSVHFVYIGTSLYSRTFDVFKTFITLRNAISIAPVGRYSRALSIT